MVAAIRKSTASSEVVKVKGFGSVRIKLFLKRNKLEIQCLGMDFHGIEKLIKILDMEIGERYEGRRDEHGNNEGKREGQPGGV